MRRHLILIAIWAAMVPFLLLAAIVAWWVADDVPR